MSIKEQLEDISRKSPIGKCDCINSHHKGVILAAIADDIRAIDDTIKRYKKEGEPKGPGYVSMDYYINEKLNLEATRDKLIEIPYCK